MISASIIIATCGDSKWRQLALRRALPSASRFDQAEIAIYHGPNDKIHEARNAGARMAQGEWLCFLDADDELEPGYVEAMLRAEGDLRYPRVRYVDPKSSAPLPAPTTLFKTHLFKRNYMVIGTFVRRELFFNVGGFEEFPSWEDWALWIKCWLAGAQSVLVKDAIYRSYMNPAGRCTVQNSRALHDSIVARYAPRAQALGLA